MRRRPGVISVFNRMWALWIGAALVFLTALPGPGSQADAAAAAPNQLVSLTLAKGIKSASAFGQGELTPVQPTSVFFNTDLPYAVLKFKMLQANTEIMLQVSDPQGTAFAIDVKAPRHRDSVWGTFDFALPLYILGTDLETITGTWTLQVVLNGEPLTSTTFQWQTASPLQLGIIKDLLNADPMSADLHWRYGAALALLNHPQEGIDELQNAIKLDPRYALYYITLGRVYEREGRSADAIKMFEAALRMHGSYYDAVYSGWAHVHLARLQAH
jgi:tetratricopeptide (TPR) repeat protein